jgi:hypothetical protein
MLLKVVALFLIFMIVMASVQKFLRGGKTLPGGRKRTALDRLRCAKCRRILIAEKPGPCDRADCEYR